MGRPSGGLPLAAWILVVIGAILMIIIGAASLEGISRATSPLDPGGWAFGRLIEALLSIVIGIIILVLRVAEKLDEWVWIGLATILALIALSNWYILGGWLILIGAILAIIAKPT